MSLPKLLPKSLSGWSLRGLLGVGLCCLLSTALVSTALVSTGFVSTAFAKPPPKLAPSHYTTLTLDTFRKSAAFAEVIDLEKPDLERLQAAIFFVANEARVIAGQPAIEYHPALSRAAAIHAQRMVQMNFFAHENPHDADLRTPADRARQVGIANPTLAENLALEFALVYTAGEPIYAVDPVTFHFSYKPGGPRLATHTYLSLAERVVDQWLESAPHEENMMFEDIVQTGIGAALTTDQGFPRFKIVQLFQWDEHIRTLR